MAGFENGLYWLIHRLPVSNTVMLKDYVERINTKNTMNLFQTTYDDSKVTYKIKEMSDY